MFGGSWRVGRIAGIDVRVDVSWVLIAVLISYSLITRFRFAFPALNQGLLFALGIGFALLFFGSILFHEMAHALVARRRGIEVHGITLFMFGGATHARVESRGPTDELIVSVVGPFSSLLLAGAFFLAHVPFLEIALPVAGGLRYLAGVNLALAIFNMVPGFPLDGGRVLRAIVWRVTGSMSKATRVASISGQVVGYGLIGLGIVALATTGRVGSAIWFVFIGWFLAQAARAAGSENRADRPFRSIRAEEVMTRTEDPIPADGLPTVGPDEPMDQVVLRLQASERVLVVAEDRVVGSITSADVVRWLDQRRSVAG